MEYHVFASTRDGSQPKWGEEGQFNHIGSKAHGETRCTREESPDWVLGDAGLGAVWG